MVHQRGVSCTECGFGGVWYTGGVSPVPSAAFVAFGTPEGCLLYRVRLWWRLVHQRGVSRTECGVSAGLYTRGVSPVPSVALVAFGTPEGCFLYRVWLWWRFGTPEECLLYRVRLWWQLVRQRGVSCTECGFGGVWYTRGVSPVPSAALVAVGTPEGALRYKSTLKIPLASLKLSKDLC